MSFFYYLIDLLYLTEKAVFVIIWFINQQAELPEGGRNICQEIKARKQRNVFCRSV